MTNNRTMIEGVITITGPKTGKTVSIIGGVHGNEECGVRAIKELLPKIKITAGKIHFIYGNPLAIARVVRQTGMNLNRAFLPEKELTDAEKLSYERKRALEIMPFLEQSDALLDLHASQSKNTIPFVICEPPSFVVAKQLSFPIISCGWDELEPGSTDYFMNKMGKIGLCIECGYHYDSLSVARAKRTISDFLNLMGLTEGKISIFPSKQRPKIIRVHSIYHTKKNFSPAREFADFEGLKKGELIGRDGTERIFAPDDDYIVFCRRRKNSGEEAFLLGEDLEVISESSESV